MPTHTAIPADILLSAHSLSPVIAKFGIQLRDRVRLGSGYVRYEISARPVNEHALIRAVLDTGIPHCLLCDSRDGRHWLTVPREGAHD